MTMSWKRATALVATAIFVAALGACESSETIAPDGSTITVGANPATIPLGSGSECSLIRVSSCGTANVTATVYSKMGIPLADQDVRFDTTAGFLFTGSLTSPVAAGNLPITTDKFGNANVFLITSTTSTVTARSGTATGTRAISTVQGNLSNILLLQDTTTAGCSTDLNVTSCSQKVCFKAKASDSSNAPVQGVVVLFSLQNNVVTNGSSTNTFNVTFTPSQTTTDASGNALTFFVPDSTCPAQCAGAGKTCKGEVIATTQGGAFPSPPQILNINIP